MTRKPDTGNRKSPGTTVREAHERAKQRSLAHQAAGKTHNKLAQPQNRWQRAVRYTWDKNRGRG
jgi:hypothetical protein